MGIIEFLIFAAVIGLIAWVLTTYIPMSDPIKRVIMIGAVVLIVLLLLQAMGLLSFDRQIPRVR